MILITQWREDKEKVVAILRGLPVKEHFVAMVNYETIEWFEDNKWFTLSNDYRWFLRHLGHGGVGFTTLGMERVSKHLHIFHAMKEAQYLLEFIPLKDFLLLQHLNEGDFYYTQTNHHRQERETAPVYRWNHSQKEGSVAYPTFYSYFLHQLQMGLD